MNCEQIQIKEGIKFHKIQTNKFKTDLFAVFFSVPLNRETITKNALIAAVLRRGTKNMKTQEEISKHLEEMYGAGFDCGIEKSGDTHTIKFYLETINDNFLPKKENLLEEGFKTILEIAFNPLIENGAFKKEYVEQEKQNLKQIIEGKIDNKGQYALERCIEEMYKGELYGLYKYGYIEDLEKINEKDLYEHYKNVINTCKIDIFASGQLPEQVNNIVENDKNISNLPERKDFKITENSVESNKEVKTIEESMDVSQGKLVLGLDIIAQGTNLSYSAMVYNTILGSGANSKLFQNVREKASLAYTCGSSYIKRKNIILIRAGIEIENYKKALEIIEKQLEDMKNGEFSDEDIKNAKRLIISTIDNIEEEQDTEISYYFGQELAGTAKSIEEYRQKIEFVSREDILNIANNIKLNTIYFLKN